MLSTGYARTGAILDRNIIAFKDGSRIKKIDLENFKKEIARGHINSNTIVFNTLINTKEEYEATYYSATANPFKFAAWNVGAEANAIRVAVIDKGADIQLTLDGALTTSTIGTQVQNTAGTKSGYIYAWDGSSNKVSLITSDTWTTSDIVENGVSAVSYTNLKLPTILHE